MAGNFEFHKVCQFCGNKFIAQKSTTKYCSLTCASRAYKERQKEKRLQDDSREIRETNRQKLVEQEYLSITETAELLSISRPTVYRMIADGQLQVLRLGERTTRIKRSDLEQVQNVVAPINTPIKQIAKVQDEYIGASQAQEMFSLSPGWFYRKVKLENVPKKLVDGKTVYPLKQLKKIFSKNQFAEINDWYTIDEIIEKFNVTRQYVYEYTSDHKTPKRRQGREILISKIHWDESRGVTAEESTTYYTVLEATEKYKIGRNYLYDLIRTYKIPKTTKGRNVLINRAALDELFSNRKR